MSNNSLLSGRIFKRLARFALDISLTIDTGDRLALIGPNGSGKSSILSVLTGFMQPDNGTNISLRNTPLQGVPTDARRFGYLAQESLLFPHLTALENVAFGARSSNKNTRLEKALHELKLCGAEYLANSKPREMSGGEKQKVALARALATDPELLILDEPFAALDINAAADLRELTAKRAEQTKVALIIATHDLVDVVRLADRVLVLENGTVIESVSVNALRTTPQSDFATSFAGLSKITGEVTKTSNGMAFRHGNLLIKLPATLADTTVGDGKALVVHPADLEIVPATTAGAITDTVVNINGNGSHIIAQLACGLTVQLPHTKTVSPGSEISFVVSHAQIMNDSNTAHDNLY